MSKSFCENEKQITTLPLFSVIILTYLQRHFIEECIDSVLMQDYPNIELVVCDDCSADFDTQEVIVSDDGSDNFPEEAVNEYIACNKSSNIKSVKIHREESNVGTVKHLNHAVKICLLYTSPSPRDTT